MKIENSDIELLRDILDYLYALKSEWSWFKNEPRNGYQKMYYELDEVIKKYTEFLDRLEIEVKEL